MQKEPASNHKAIRLALNGIQKPQLLKSLMTRRAKAGIIVRHEAGFRVTLSFSTSKKKTIFKVTLENGKVLSVMEPILQGSLEKLGCEATSLDPYACIFDYLDIFVLSVP